MANQAFSRSDDLMVGAGVLYFKRDDDPNGFHHLGNCEDFTINTDITKVEKNSSMNKKRELMATVATAVKPTGSLTVTEYNPYNFALGVFGNEGVYHQQGATLVGEPYVVGSVPGIINLVDANGNTYYDVKNVVVRPQGTSVPSVKMTTAFNTDWSITTTTTTDDTLKDNVGGGILTIAVAGSTLATDEDIYICVESGTTGAGDVAGLVLKVKEGLAGTTQTITFGSGTTDTQTLASGITITATVNASETINATVTTPAGDPLQGHIAKYTAPVGAYVNGVDYVVDLQENRAGMIKIKSGGKINKGDVVLVDATIPDKDFITVSGGAAGDIKGEIRFVGDPNLGGQYVIEGWKVKINPDGDFTGLISDDFGSFTLTMDFLSDYENHKDYPYYKATLIGRADGEVDKPTSTYDPEY